MAAPAITKLKELLGLIKDTAVDLKTDFAEESKFQKWRIVTGLVFLVDVVATFVVVLLLASGGESYQAWLESGGPTNMLMIRSDTDRVQKGVEVLLDGKYRAVVDLRGRSTGLAVGSVFADEEGFGPTGDYRPRKVELVIDGDRVTVPLGAKR